MLCFCFFRAFAPIFHFKLCNATDLNHKVRGDEGIKFFSVFEFVTVYYSKLCLHWIGYHFVVRSRAYCLFNGLYNM